MKTVSSFPPCADVAIADELNARLGATVVDADCLAAALLLLAEQRGIGRVARSCGMSNATFRRQMRSARGLPLSTLMRVLQVVGLRVQLQVAGTVA